MTANQTARALRIESMIQGDYIICVGAGFTYRAFGCAVSMKAAKALRAAIRKDPVAYGIV